MPPAKREDVVFDIRHTAPQHRQFLEFEVNQLILAEKPGSLLDVFERSKLCV